MRPFKVAWRFVRGFSLALHIAICYNRRVSESGKMRDELANASRGHNADYVEIRLEESQVTRIVYRGQRLEEIGRTTSLGGNVRALVKGGWGFVSFNNVKG